jgi:hypothetical protein
MLMNIGPPDVHRRGEVHCGRVERSKIEFEDVQPVNSLSYCEP